MRPGAQRPAVATSRQGRPRRRRQPRRGRPPAVAAAGAPGVAASAGGGTGVATGGGGGDGPTAGRAGAAGQTAAGSTLPSAAPGQRIVLGRAARRPLLRYRDGRLHGTAIEQHHLRTTSAAGTHRPFPSSGRPTRLSARRRRSPRSRSRTGQSRSGSACARTTRSDGTPSAGTGAARSSGFRVLVLRCSVIFLHYASVWFFSSAPAPPFPPPVQCVRGAGPPSPETAPWPAIRAVVRGASGGDHPPVAAPQVQVPASHKLSVPRLDAHEDGRQVAAFEPGPPASIRRPRPPPALRPRGWTV